jgi:hypothetical protein
MTTNPTVEKTVFQSSRISRHAAITLNDSVDKVFPLFGPIREREWCEGWDPQILFSTTNLVEEHMVFRTKGRFAQEEFYHWVITQYDPVHHHIEYTVSTQNRIWFIRVQCKAHGKQSMATVSYTFTSLNALGTELNAIALKKMFECELQDWEEAINYYLQTGTMLTK